VKPHVILSLIILDAVSVVGLQAQEPPVTAKQTPPPQAKVPEGVRVERDLEYAKVGDKKLLLDLYLPEKTGRPLPGIVGIRGG
jgi:hypothetical protein